MIANNYKSIGIHIIVSILVVILYLLFDRDYDSTLILSATISSFAYVILGFIFLKPVSKYSYFSTLSVLIVFVLVILICYCIRGPKIVLLYWFTNISYGQIISEFFWKFFNASDNDYDYLISAMIPSFFMYLGLVLKMLWSRVDLSSAKNNQE